MPNDVFRFLTVRPPQRARPADDETVLQVANEPGRESNLHLDLRRLRARQDREAMNKIAEAFGRSAEAVRDLRDLSLAFAELDRDLPADRQGVMDAISRIFGATPAEIVKTESFRRDRVRLADSLLAATVAPRKSGLSQQPLLRGLRLAHAIEGLSRGRVPDPARVRIRLPGDVFPLPAAPGDDAEDLRRKHEDEVRKREDRRRARRGIAELIVRNEAAIVALRNARRREAAASTPTEPEADATPPRHRIHETGTDLRDSRPMVRSIGVVVRPTVLSREALARLEPATREALESVVDGDQVDALSAAEALEQENARLYAELHANPRYDRVVRVGDVFVPHDDFGDVFVPPHDQVRIPGLCDPPDPESPAISESTVPSGVGQARPVGIADLMTVRQDIVRYEAGEVAHIENVLQGERKERTHRRARRTEESFSVERETIEETERDLQTTERFELQLETSKVVAQDTSLEAGVTVTGRYGPTVEVSASTAFALDTSREDSNFSATTYSRDVTSRAINRIQERVREERTRVTIEDFEEINTHTLDAVGADGHVTGIYRWVEKIYEAQVVNYGRRLLLEFIVPEPAALYRHAVSTHPVEGLTLARPEPPGYCVRRDSTFVPLSPADLSPSNYMFWVSKYGVENVEPPPPASRIVATAFDEPFTKDDPDAIAKSSKELTVPPGYRAKEAWYVGNIAQYKYADDDSRVPTLQVYLGRHLLRNGHARLDGEDNVVPIAILALYALVIGLTIEVLCERSPETFREWQLKTYAAIMAAYEERRSAYEAQLRAATVDEGVAIRGRNPLRNREIERTELKRGALSLLTGQHFDAFDAMRRGVPPHRLPQADLAEAEAEGRYVQFFEQAFEWVHVTYFFYPYFWTRKQDWAAILNLDDTDPLFAAFLQAGSARVQVPVRPGHERAVLNYLESGELWDGGDPPEVDDPLYLSIVDEIKEQQGAVFVKSSGTISVTNGSRTVSGNGTAFDADDVDREVRIAGRTYRIAEVNGPTALVLAQEYSGDTDPAARYAVGAKLVGEPWEVRIPTSLVLLQPDAGLPEFTDE